MRRACDAPIFCYCREYRWWVESVAWDGKRMDMCDAAGERSEESVCVLVVEHPDNKMQLFALQQVIAEILADRFPRIGIMAAVEPHDAIIRQRLQQWTAFQSLEASGPMRP